MKFTDYKGHEVEVNDDGWFVCTALNKRAQTYTALVESLDRYEANQERQKKAKADKVKGMILYANLRIYGDESQFFWPATLGVFERSYGGLYDVWATFESPTDKKPVRKKISASTVYLDNAHNKPLIVEIEDITARINELKSKRDKLLEKMEKIKPPEGIQ